ncbi:hypothetical protein [Wolbachia endosymbiont (group A) of Sphecodes monilicornis]|nr:hypothetical protein [Wolbachia endosymbiont (group A) of Sphecodes monilicornis]
MTCSDYYEKCYNCMISALLSLRRPVLLINISNIFVFIYILY